ncbi:MAG: 16S rRNA processing protein RimM [Proteobacteria bacterium]|nr:16S rRNA processing protein RimM [Pseudomonadota bacterium]MCP4921932.1 16S rRNA processing protein RimM [Pseudomonadota bacterium]
MYGTRGELRIHLHDRESTLLHSGGVVVLCGPKGERLQVRMTTRGGPGNRILAHVSPGVGAREKALAYKDWEIVASEQILPDLEDGEYYHRDLIGLEVRDSDGNVLGKLAEIHESGPIDIWTVRGGEEEMFVPALADVIVSVDVAAGHVVIRA